MDRESEMFVVQTIQFLMERITNLESTVYGWDHKATIEKMKEEYKQEQELKAQQAYDYEEFLHWKWDQVPDADAKLESEKLAFDNKDKDKEHGLLF